METALEIINKYSIGDNEWAKRILKAEAAGGFSEVASFPFRLNVVTLQALHTY